MTEEQRQIKVVLEGYTDEQLKQLATDLDLAQQPDISRDRFIEYLVTQNCVGCSK